MSGQQPSHSEERPLRIAVVTNMAAPYTTQIFERLAARDGCRLLVVYETEMEPNRAWKMPERLAYEHVVLPSWTLDLRRVVSEVFVHVPWRPLAPLRRFRPDVVVASGGAWTSLTNLAALAGRRRHGWAYVLLYESTAHPAPSTLQRAVAPFVRRVMSAGDAWIVPGTRARSRALELGADPDRTFVAPTHPALPLEHVDGALPRGSDEPFTFLCVGQLVERKGVDYLIRALHDVPEARLWLAGDGPLRAQLEAAAPHGRVDFFGHLDWQGLQDLYRRADAFVFPSLYDVWGLVLNEALAHGLPVVVTDGVGAADDLVVDGVNGLVVPTHSAPALAEAMRAVAAWDEGQRSRAAALGAEKVSWYTPDVAADIVLSACRAAVNRRSRL